MPGDAWHVATDEKFAVSPQLQLPSVNPSLFNVLKEILPFSGCSCSKYHYHYIISFSKVTFRWYSFSVFFSQELYAVSIQRPNSRTGRWGSRSPGTACHQSLLLARRTLHHHHHLTPRAITFVAVRLLDTHTWLSVPLVALTRLRVFVKFK